MTKIYRYFAAGSGQFPDDMLRYDQARVIAYVREVGIGLTGYMIEGERPPTQGRWNSFMWSTAPLRSMLPAGSSEAGPVTWEIERGGHWEPFHYVLLGRDR